LKCCPECGHEYEVNGRELINVDGKLVEMNVLEERNIKNKKKTEQAMAKTLDELIAVGKSRGYKNPAAWAARVFAGRMRKWIQDHDLQR